MPSKDFIILDNKRFADDKPKHGHATRTSPYPAVSGGPIIKKSNYTHGVFGSCNAKWVNSQKFAQQISNEIIKKHNPAYFVPRTFIVANKVYEQTAPGLTVFEIQDKYPEYIELHKEELSEKLAQFINDFSELRSVKNELSDNEYSAYNSLMRLSKNITKLTGIINASDIKILQDAIAYLINLPEMRVQVYYHGDLTPRNILIDMKTNVISIIDFELSGYKTKFDILYQTPMSKYPGIQKVWEYVNRLPRTKNPNLVWNFSYLVLSLYKSLGPCRNAIGEYLDPDIPSRYPPSGLAEYCSMHCKNIQMILGQIKMKKTQTTNLTHSLIPVRL